MELQRITSKTTCETASCFRTKMLHLIKLPSLVTVIDQYYFVRKYIAIRNYVIERPNTEVSKLC